MICSSHFPFFGKYYAIFVYILQGKMGKRGKNGKKIMQLRWPKYQKPKDKNMGWTKQLWHHYFLWGLSEILPQTPLKLWWFLNIYLYEAMLEPEPKTCQIFQVWAIGSFQLRIFQANHQHWKVQSNRPRVSVQGVESLWGDCRFIPAYWGQSSRFVLFCSFWRLFTMKMIKSVKVFPFSFWKIIIKFKPRA